MTGSWFEFCSEFLRFSGVQSDLGQKFDVSLFVMIIEWEGLVRGIVTGKYVGMPEIDNRGSEHTGWQELDMLQKQQQVGTVCSGDSGLLADQPNRNKWF